MRVANELGHHQIGVKSEQREANKMRGSGDDKRAGSRFRELRADKQGVKQVSNRDTVTAQLPAEIGEEMSAEERLGVVEVPSDKCGRTVGGIEIRQRQGNALSAYR